MIDEIDRKIILKLQREGRCRSAILAKQMGISPSSVSRRINRLLREQIIKITAVPDPGKVGYNTMAIIGLGAKWDKIDDICNRLINHQNVHFLALVFGRFDIVLRVFFPSSEMLVDFVKDELAKIDGLRQIETFYVAELKKQTYGWLQDSPT
jgi:Lrp/AsnC family transcriptional regulator for asnA, asnC and gidA